MKLKTSIALGGFFILFISALPAFSASETGNPSQQAWQYSVQKNDSLQAICKKYCVHNADLNKLAQLNQIKNPNIIQPNQMITIPYTYLRVTNFPAHVLVANGDVRIKKNDTDTFIKLQNNESIFVGDTVQTGTNSIVKIKFADGSTSNLQPNSSLTLLTSQQYAGKSNFYIKVQLSKGRTEIVANPQHLQQDQLEVETPTAVAAVRGTVFRVGAEKNNTIEETLQGLVSVVANAQEVSVGQQYGTVAREGQPPLAPQKLPAPPETNNLSSIVSGTEASLNIPEQTGLTWVAQLAKDANFNEMVDSQSGTGTLRLKNLAIGQYFLKLRHQDAHGLQSEDATHIFQVQAALPKLILIAPLGQTLAGNFNIFSWQNLPQHAGYTIQIAKDASFQQLVLTRSVSFNTFYLQEALPTGQYYWRVAAKYVGPVPAGATTEFSESGEFSF